MATAVLLLAHGSPENLDEMAGYLQLVRRGRPAPEELIKEMQRRYGLVPGGVSPLLARTREQAEALQKRLGDEYTVYVGMRFWRPFIVDAVREVVAESPDKIVAVPMAPQYSTLSVGAYEREVKEAMVAAMGTMPLEVKYGWHEHPHFIGALAANLHAALDGRDDVPVIFTVHSLPARVIDDDDPYPRQSKETAKAVADSLGLARWRFAYQSAGATEEEWLGPDVEEVVGELADEGHKDVVLQPVGFVCDHVEILYDVDIQYREFAEARGIRLTRTESLNDAPQFIEALAEIVK